METIALRITPPLERPDLPGLFARVCAELETHRPRVVLCDVSGVAADAVAVDALARLCLAAQRHRCRIVLSGTTRELDALVALVGLASVL
jgi:ABC-type transporter Mla MlaB component